MVVIDITTPTNNFHQSEGSIKLLDLNRYTRVPFHVTAVQVTPGNLMEVAEWCGGDVRTTSVEVTPETSFIKVRVKRPLTARQTQAFVGDWVLAAGAGFKVYTDPAFSKCFALLAVPVED